MNSSDAEPVGSRHVLVVEDEPNLQKVIAAHLRRAGYQVSTAHDVASARTALNQGLLDLVITDLKMSVSERDGLDVLRRVQEQAPPGIPPIPVVILTAYGTADKALEALKQGAYNLISKPCDMVELITQVGHALKAHEASVAKALSTSEPEGQFGLIGTTPQIKEIFDTLATIADTPVTVLITGESGTGKELVARALHQYSGRADKPFVRINCAAIPEQLLESELFGFEKGSFTGAVGSKPGKLEQADGGTVFLDEIGEMKPELQVKLLRFLQEQELERIGSVRPVKVDVRVVAATNRDLAAEVRAGNFREDLYYRLQVIPMVLPPLRDRRGDIPALVRFFIAKYNHRLQKQVVGADKTLLEALSRFVWPGNIRELENVVERMMLFSETSMLGIRHLPPEISARLEPALIENEGTSTSASPVPSRGTPPLTFPLPAPASRKEAQEAQGDRTAPQGSLTFKDYVREETYRLEREFILQALEESGWNITRTADKIGLSRKGLQMKLKDLDIRKPGG